jgi:hypothetical protein
MNYSTAIFLVNKDVRAVSVSYERDAEGRGVKPFEPFKTMDPSLGVGDMVVIPTATRHRMTVVRVEEVDFEIELDSTAQLSWIIGPVDTGAYDAIAAQEAHAIERIKSAEKAAKRKELADKLLADNPDLQALSGVNPDAAPALSAPPAA